MLTEDDGIPIEPLPGDDEDERTLKQVAPAEAASIPHEVCGFVNTETRQNCKNSAAYIVTMPPICHRLLVCGLHARPFVGRAGAELKKVGGAR